MEYPDQIQKQLRILAHDLRNSLSAIYSCAQLLEVLLEKGPVQAQKTNKTIIESVQNMEHVIKTKLDPLKGK